MILTNKHNHITTTYYLSLKKKMDLLKNNHKIALKIGLWWDRFKEAKDNAWSNSV